MNIHEYRAWLDQRIAQLGSELETYLLSRKTLDLAEGQTNGKQAPAVKELAKPRHKNQTSPNREEWARIKNAMLAYLELGKDSWHAANVLVVAGVGTQPRKMEDTQRAYAVLGELRTKGLCQYDAQVRMYRHKGASE